MENSKPTDPSIEPEYSGLSLEKTLLAIVTIVALGAIIIYVLNIYKPEAKKSGPKPNIVSVEASTPRVIDYPIIISSNGSVSAAIQSRLVAQVAGEITHITEQFANGAEFKKGDLLLSIDKRNYLASISSAQASLSQAQASFDAEQANADQAKKDWSRLGYQGEPNDRVLRKPQMKAAKAQLDAAKASLSKAQLDYSRTQIRAPYNGSVISKNVGLGQFVSIGSQLGEIFSNEGLEVQLPLNQEQYAQLDLSSDPLVTLTADLAGVRHEWPARIVRIDRTFNTSTRQLNATAKVDNIISNSGLELKIGQYVRGTIQGRIAKQANVIPNSAVREGSYIFIIENGSLQRQNIDTVWQDDQNTIIKNIRPDSLVVSTSLSGVVSGTKAKLVGSETSEKNTQSDIAAQNATASEKQIIKSMDKK